jgi:hypothetical protein
VHCVDHSYDVGDRVLLWVKPHKSLIKFGKGASLNQEGVYVTSSLACTERTYP